MRVVLDTNVVISALCFAGGSTAGLRRAWQSGAVTPLASKQTIGELIRVLAYPKFALSAVEQHDLLADYLPWCEPIAMPATAPAAPRCRDPHDEAFLELAIVGAADLLVTGDGDLLALDGTLPFHVGTPGAMAR